MDETMVLYSERWRLPLDAIRQSYVSLLINPTKKPVNASVRAAIAAHPGVARETELYEYAVRKFDRDMARVHNREAKVASIRAAAFACSLQGNCSGTAPASISGADDDDE